MQFTVDLDDHRSIRLTDQRLEARPPDRVAISAEGTITLTRELLGEFEGTSVKPVCVEIAVDESRTVETDLEDRASLELETVDVGVETPDASDLSPEANAIRSSSEDENATGAPPGALAFTIEGTITDVPTETLDRIADGSPTLESITFAVDDPVRGDGGPGGGVAFEFGLFGYRIVVRRNGVIDIGTRGATTGAGIL